MRPLPARWRSSTARMEISLRPRPTAGKVVGRGRSGVRKAQARETRSSAPLPAAQSSCQWPVSGLGSDSAPSHASRVTGTVASAEHAQVRACLPLRGQHRLSEAGVPSRRPVSRFHRTSAVRHHQLEQSVTERTDQALRRRLDRRSSAVLRSIHHPGRRMITGLELLAGKVTELARLLQSLRTENQQLRAQLGNGGPPNSMRCGVRVDEAGRRLGGLIERLPGLAQCVARGTGRSR